MSECDHKNCKGYQIDKKQTIDNISNILRFIYKKLLKKNLYNYI